MKYKKSVHRTFALITQAGNQHDRSDSAVCLGGGWLEEKVQTSGYDPFYYIGSIGRDA